MKIVYAIRWMILAVVMGACANRDEPACKDPSQCTNKCANIASCSMCAAQPDCGWCGGSNGKCVPVVSEDHRDQRPGTCSTDWFFRTADPSVPAGAPFCPAAPVTGPENMGGH